MRANHLDWQFTVEAPNQVWADDITCVWMGLDLYARRPVGWALALRADSALTRKALTMAYESRGEPKGVLFHSDQGSQYASRAFRQRADRAIVQAFENGVGAHPGLRIVGGC